MHGSVGISLHLSPLLWDLKDPRKGGWRWCICQSGPECNPFLCWRTPTIHRSPQVRQAPSSTGRNEKAHFSLLPLQQLGSGSECQLQPGPWWHGLIRACLRRDYLTSLHSCSLSQPGSHLPRNPVSLTMSSQYILSTVIDIFMEIGGFLFPRVTHEVILKWWEGRQELRKTPGPG